jgi:hypothetical protein
MIAFRVAKTVAGCGFNYCSNWDIVGEEAFARFRTLQNHFNAIDFSLLLPGVMTIAQEGDAPPMEAMES